MVELQGRSQNSFVHLEVLKYCTITDRQVSFEDTVTVRWLTVTSSGRRTSTWARQARDGVSFSGWLCCYSRWACLVGYFGYTFVVEITFYVHSYYEWLFRLSLAVTDIMQDRSWQRRLMAASMPETSFMIDYSPYLITRLYSSSLSETYWSIFEV